ncbi:aminotransferase class I/II-fold pyridoxal phosphate-dependent enzyme [Paenibacillus daejeonensis]|uniref:aminotransferase class I/II-fold pyridoxal phosphate-dependent enzyme n=1 Tax=Paenibacillus daejeonensis TaxID=135193 RepID=UPI00037E8954|nr:aminotransferase class I/II-fold pyridoxal phosphate-dependent enzyme [Paenibacillus daejeonensis]
MSTTRWRSERLKHLGSAIFAEVGRWKAEARAAGIDVIDLGIGSPDLPPAELLREELSRQALRVDRYGYPTSRGNTAFLQQASDWLAHRFGIAMDPEHELLALMGSQDGLAHLALAITNPGDKVLLPDPGYPIYAAGAALAGVEPIYYPLREQTDFLPDLDGITEEQWREAAYMIVNIPGNPVSAVADLPFFERLLATARKYNVLIVHDLAYSEMAFDGWQPPSILQITGASDIAVEFHSLSKSFNLAGCRIGFLAGNREAVGALADLKANIDYGVFEAVQHTAIAALKADMERGSQPPVGALYQARRDRFAAALREEGWEITLPRATMFLWVKIPVLDGGTRWTSRQISREMIMQAGVAVIPGDAFGKEGEGYVRIAIVEQEERLVEAARRIGRFLRTHGLTSQVGQEEAPHAN